MKQQAKALSLALIMVAKQTKLNQANLAEKLEVNIKTLCRIRDARQVKQCTYEHVLCMLYDIIEQEYQNDLVITGGESATAYLRIMRTLLRVVLGCS